MVGKIYISGVIGTDCTLLDVIKQVKAQKESTSFLVKIDSVGGVVSVGYDIYNYLKNLSVPVTTYAMQAYSIASVVFMAGQSRLVAQDAENVLMIHLPWAEVQGDYLTLNEYAFELKKVEDELVKFYSTAIEIDNDTIHSLLKSETFLNATQALELGFATETQVVQKAVAKLHNENKENQKNLMTRLNDKIDKLMNLLSGKIKAELILQDSTGVELVFTDLADTDVPEIGTTVTLDSKPADGEFLMPDGSTYVVEKGVLTEIRTAETEEEQPTEQTDEPTAKAEIIKEVAKFEIDVNNTTFEVGETLKYTYEDVEYSVGAGEYELAEGKRIVTNADGVIVEVKDGDAIEAPAEQQPTDDANAKETEKLFNTIELLAKRNQELESKFNALAKSIGSDFNPTKQKENKVNVKASSERTSRAFQILNS